MRDRLDIDGAAGSEIVDSSREKILLSDFASTPTATTDVAKSSSNLHDPNDIDPLQSNSREYFASQLQRIDHRVSPFYSMYVVQYDVETIAVAHNCVTLKLQSRGVNNFKRLDPLK
jgi:hypothetical protein